MCFGWHLHYLLFILFCIIVCQLLCLSVCCIALAIAVNQTAPLAHGRDSSPIQSNPPNCSVKFLPLKLVTLWKSCSTDLPQPGFIQITPQLFGSGLIVQH